MLKDNITVSPVQIQPNTPEPLLRAADVARYLAISKTAAYRLMDPKSGLLPVVRFAGSVRVRPADLERFVEKNLQGGLLEESGIDGHR